MAPSRSRTFKKRKLPAFTGQVELAQIGAAFLGMFIIPAIWTYAWLVTWVKHQRRR